MFDNKLIAFENLQSVGSRHSGNLYARHYSVALHLFRSTFHKGKVFRLKSRMLKRPQWLHDLNTLKPDLHLRGSSYAGIQCAPVRSIIGSEGRIADFDREFHPISEAARERWVSIAIAHLACVPLPPIQLIQIGEVYFVRDGHHRISVSRAFGQVAMDAEVVAWKVMPPFPWQPARNAASELTYPLG